MNPTNTSSIDIYEQSNTNLVSNHPPSSNINHRNEMEDESSKNIDKENEIMTPLLTSHYEQTLNSSSNTNSSSSSLNSSQNDQEGLDEIDQFISQSTKGLIQTQRRNSSKDKINNNTNKEMVLSVGSKQILLGEDFSSTSSTNQHHQEEDEDDERSLLSHQSSLSHLPYFNQFQPSMSDQSLTSNTMKNGGQDVEFYDEADIDSLMVHNRQSRSHTNPSQPPLPPFLVTKSNFLITFALLVSNVAISYFIDDVAIVWSILGSTIRFLLNSNLYHLLLLLI